MRRFSIVLTLLALAGSLALAACGGNGALDTPSPHDSSAIAGPTSPAGSYIVVLKPGTAPTAVTALTAQLATAPAFIYDTALLGFAGQLGSAEVARLKADPRVAYVEADRQVKAFDTALADQVAAPEAPAVVKTVSFAQVTPWGVSRIHAPQNANKGTGIGVAIIDTGIDLTHPDLAHVVAGANFVRTGQAPNDDNGHGTHVAGIVAAADNSIGYVGVAPDATVIAVKVLNRNGSGTMSGVIAGVNWVASHKTSSNISVANMSLGAPGYSQALHDAIQGATNAGVTFVVAAGNSSANAANYSPSGFDNVITASALNPNDTFAYYSNWGSVIDLIAPGTSIPSLYKNHGYATLSGTSMASPHVAGSAALWIKDHPSDAFTAVRSALIAAGESGVWTGDPDGVYEPLVNAQSL